MAKTTTPAKGTVKAKPTAKSVGRDLERAIKERDKADSRVTKLRARLEKFDVTN